MTRNQVILIIAAAILLEVLTFGALGAGLLAGFVSERKAHPVKPMQIRWVNAHGETVSPPSGSTPVSSGSDWPPRDLGSTQLPNTRD
jgi:hypothetical protein